MIINPDTGISIGIAASGIMTAISCTYTLTRRHSALLTRIAAMESKLEQIIKTDYTMSAAAEHSLRMALMNPNLHVPDPRDPSKILQVMGGISR